MTTKKSKASRTQPENSRSHGEAPSGMFDLPMDCRSVVTRQHCSGISNLSAMAGTYFRLDPQSRRVRSEGFAARAPALWFLRHQTNFAPS